MSVTVEQFLQRLENSGVLSVDSLRAGDVQLAAKQNKTARDLARELVRRKIITKYQAAVVYEGRPQLLSLGIYTILDKIGEGGMGQVFRAQHRRMKRVVAIKVLTKPAVTGDYAFRRFQREVEAAARLVHPNIVAAYDAGEDKGFSYLVMEYVEGIDLAKLVKKKGPLKIERAIDYIVQAAKGLEYAHAQGIVHRDIKPANLLLDTQGVVKILDMGLAQFDTPLGDVLAQADLTSTGSIMGTIDYMAPEQALNPKEAAPHSDVYSLGCALHYLLTGASVFQGDSLMKRLLAHREQPIPSLRAARPDVSPAIDAIFQKMLAKDPSQRFADMTETLAKFRECPASSPVSAPAVSKHVPGVEPAADTIAKDTFDTEDDEISAMFDFAPALEVSEPAPQAEPTGSSGNDSARGRAALRRAAANAGFWAQNGRTIKILSAAIVVLFVVVPGAMLLKADPENALARWVLENQGRVQCAVGDQMVDVSSAQELPKGSFRLQSVSLADSPRVSDADCALLARTQSLVSLDLSQTAVTDAGLNQLAGLQSLRILDLSNTRISDAGLIHLAAMRRLQLLKLEVPRLTDRGLAYIDGLDELTSLDLATTQITGAGLRNLQHMTKLEHLQLRGAKIDDESIEHITRLRTLVYINLGETGVTDRALGELRKLPRLDTLVLHETQVTCDGLKQLAGMDRLNRLDLAGTKVADAGLEALLDLPALERLDLSDTAISDDSLLTLSKLSRLKQLSVHDVRVSEEGLKRLGAVLPNCQLSF